MKRYRILQFDFDTRAMILIDPIRDEREEKVKYENRSKIEQHLIVQYGKIAADQKQTNFIDLKAKPLSIIAFHNRFFEQVRTSFVMARFFFDRDSKERIGVVYSPAS
ncbi:MAG: hypothetical protein V1933_01010 [Candidatus Omnitrophota bacterium]